MNHNPLDVLATQPTIAEQTLEVDRGLTAYYRHDLPGSLQSADAFSHYLLTFFLTTNQRQVTHIEGHGEYDGQMHRGDFYLCPAGVSGQTRWYSVDQTLHLSIDPGLLHRVAMATDQPDRFRLSPILKMRDRKVSCLAELFLLELQQDTAAQPLYLESLSTALCGHLLHQYGTIAPISKVPDGLSPHQLRVVLDYIQTHLANDLSLTILAEQAGISRFYFANQFKRSMEITPYQYVTRQRIERAKQLLQTKKRSIAAVALDSGFSSQGHLTKVFRQHVGLTPRVYQQQC